MRGKPEHFAEHYTQATLFWNSQTPIEKAHIMRGFRFELTKVQVPAIRERVVAMLANVDTALGGALAGELGMEMPEPHAQGAEARAQARGRRSRPRCRCSRARDGSIRTRRVAIFVADGVDGEAAQALHAGLIEQGAVPRYVGVAPGHGADRAGRDAAKSRSRSRPCPRCCSTPSRCPAARTPSKALGNVGHALEFIKDQYRHAKPILALGEGATWSRTRARRRCCRRASPIPGMLVGEARSGAQGAARFHQGHRQHRHHERADGSAAV